MSLKWCVLLVFVVIGERECKLRISPPHCTHLTKETDYASKYKFDYPVMYIPQGQHEAYQKLFCLNPPAVSKQTTAVCDWQAPPQVQFTLGDEYVHIVRQDPTGRFLGAAIITTAQLCSHNVSSTGLPLELTDLAPLVVKIPKEDTN